MQAGARSSAPLRAGRCQDQQSEILLTTNPTDTSKPAAIHPPKRCPTAPGPPHVLPSLVVADRQAAKAMTMESEDVRSPCAHAMVRWGRQLRDGAAAVVSAPLRASARSYGTRRLMQRHFAHIARIHTGERLGGEGAACLSPLASQWGGWALQRAPLPAPHAHAGLSRSIPTAGSRSPPAIPPSLDAVLPVIPLCGSGPAAVKAEPSAQRCGHAACPGPARGMEELSEGTELLRGFPSGWQNRGHTVRIRHKGRWGCPSVLVHQEDENPLHVFPLHIQGRWDSQAPASVPRQSRAWEDADPQQFSHPSGQRGPK